MDIPYSYCPTRAAITARASQRTRGAALVVGLILLMVVTLIGVTGMTNTAMTERISGNQRDRNVALQSAESALRQAMEELRTGTAGVTTISPRPHATNAATWYDCWTAGATGCPSTARHTYNFARAGEGQGAAAWGVASAPQYFVEEIDSPSRNLDTAEKRSESMTFRITARATGATETAVVILQTTYRTH